MFYRAILSGIIFGGFEQDAFSKEPRIVWQRVLLAGVRVTAGLNISNAKR